MLLGASLDDLASLSRRLDLTAGDVGAAATATRTLTQRALETIRAATLDARGRLGAELAGLLDAVTAAGATAEQTAWTGANASTFRTGYAEFTAAIRQAEAALAATFDGFEAGIAQMAAALEEHATAFAVAMGDADGAARTMARAVDTQRAALDSVMNQGMAWR